jgi:HK97 family phage major capsid protein
MPPTLIEQLTERRAERFKEMETLSQGLLDAGRDRLSDDEQARWNEIKGDLKSLDERLDDLAAARRDLEITAEQTTPREREERGERAGSEPRTYSKTAARQGVSFFRDVMHRQDVPAAAERLAKHGREYEGIVKERAGNTGNYSGLTVPQYLTDMVAPLRRAGRPLANICNGHELPDEGMTLNISRITTGTSAGIQATEGATVSNADADDTLLTVNVNTIAGYEDISRQAVDRGTGIDELLIQDLTRAYNTKIDDQIVNGSGSSGQHLGIRNVSSIIAVTYTDASPTVAELWPSLWNLVQQVQAGVFLGVSHFVMHPRRFWWIVASVGTNFPFLQVYRSPQGFTNQAGNAEGTGTYESGPAGALGPVPVILDANVPTNLGGGTNQDDILGVTADELHLWEDPDAPLFINSEQVLGNSLQVRFVMYGYSAFTAGRYPGAQGSIDGTGLVTPTF